MSNKTDHDHREPASVTLPLTPEIEVPVDAAYELVREADRRIEDLVREYRARLRTELRDAPCEHWRQKDREAGAEALARLRQWVADAYQGKFGPGQLMVLEGVREWGTKMPSRLAYVLQIENPLEQGKKKNEPERLSVGAGSVLQKGQIEQIGILEKGQDLETLSQLKTYLSHKSHVEVAGDPDPDDADQLYKKLLEEGWALSQIIEAFPADFKPKVSLGEVTPFGSCDHHSGHISGRLVVLPTARFAVISEYDGDYGRNYFRLWGVTADPRITPNWSAKHECWQGDALEDPTPEEIAFLKGQEVVGGTKLLLPEHSEEDEDEDETEDE